MEPKIFEMGNIGGEKFVSLNQKINHIMKEYDAIRFDFKGQKLAIVSFGDLILLLEKWKKEKKNV